MTSKEALAADVKALLIAPLVPGGLWVLFDGISRAATFGPTYFLGAILLGFYVIIVMEIFALIVGLPLIILLRRYLDSLLLCVLAGAFIAALPIFLLSAFATLPDFASTNGVPTVVNGQRTAQWYLELLQVIGLCSAFGALGGTTFWKIRRKTRTRAGA